MATHKARVKDFFFGRTFYAVMVLRRNDRLEAKITKTKALGRPYAKRLFRDPIDISLFVKTEYRSVHFDDIITTTHSLDDRAVVWHGGRNLHRDFIQLKHAQAYVDRINSGCLTYAERRHLAESIRCERHY